MTTPGRPPDTSTVMKLIGAGRFLQRRFEAELRETGLTLRHVGALGHLSRNPELSYSDLARRAHVTSQSMNATVRHLEEIGAVRRQGAAPGHPARLEVTDTGRQILDAVWAASDRLDTEVAAELGESDYRQLGQILDGLVARRIAAALQNQGVDPTWR